MQINIASKRFLMLVQFGEREDDDELEYVSLPGESFEPAPGVDDTADENYDPDGFGFRRQ